MARSIHTISADIDRPKIDASSIPQCDYDLACTVLYSSISLALSNPILRAEYERWKAERGDAK